MKNKSQMNEVKEEAEDSSEGREGSSGFRRKTCHNTGPWGVPLGDQPHAPGAPASGAGLWAQKPCPPEAHLDPCPATQPSLPGQAATWCMHPRGVRGPEGGEGGQTLEASHCSPIPEP